MLLLPALGGLLIGPIRMRIAPETAGARGILHHLKAPILSLKNTYIKIFLAPDLPLPPRPEIKYLEISI
jgi:hypothetical protein